MFKKCSKGILTIWLALSITGCGSKEQAIIDNYGTDSGSVIEATTAGGTVSDAVSEGSLSQKLGGTEYDWNASFTATSISVNLNAHSEITDTDQLPSYKISTISEEDLDEDAIVKNLLGSNAERLDRDLDRNKGDSKELIRSAQSLYFKFHSDDVKTLSYQDEMGISTVSGWLDEDSFFLHTYEGDYNKISYQLLVGFDRKDNAAYIAFFPKSLGEFFGNSKIDTVDSYWIGDDLDSVANVKEFLDQDKLKSGIEDRLRDAENMLRGSLGINIPDGYLGTGRDKSGMGSLYTFYLNNEALSAAGYGAIWEVGSTFDLINAFNTMGQDNYLLDGFKAAPLSAFAGQGIFEDPTGAEDVDTNAPGVYITEEGVMGFYIVYDRNYGEMLTDDVPVLNYENASKAFETVVTENLDATKCEVNQMKFNYVKLTYYAMPSPENPAESTLIPAWMFRDENTYTVVLMNAMDGSLIDIIY